jgi:hypothetical protein
VYIFYHAFTHVRFFRNEFEKCLNIITKDYNLDFKNWEGETKVEGFLYYCKATNKDAKISYDDTIYIMNHFIPKDVGISKCNLHLLWVTTIFGFVIMSPNVSNLGY